MAREAGVNNDILVIGIPVWIQPGEDEILLFFPVDTCGYGS